MSRIGKQPIKVPQKVKISINKNEVKVEGPNGSLVQSVCQGINVEYNQAESQIFVKRSSDEKRYKALHGLTRSLIANMVKGVTDGFTKNLEILGIGYNAKLQGNELVLMLGYSHPVRMKIPKELKLDITNPTNPARISVTGSDKQKVGQFAATIRAKKPPEPYKGMGIKYADEIIRRKAGKALSTGG